MLRVSTKCSDCGEPLGSEVKKCPKCGSTKRTHVVEAAEMVRISTSLRLKHRSGKKDPRGKPLREAYIKVKGDTEEKITKDRSRRLKGMDETDVYHEVWKNGKIIHGPHLEPKSKKKRKTQSTTKNLDILKETVKV